MLSRQQCTDLAIACHQNAHDLMQDARALLAAGRAPRALALAILADEELAKSILFLIAKADPDLLPNLEQVVLNHRAKHAVARVGEAYAGSTVGRAMHEAIRLAQEVRSGRLSIGDEDLSSFILHRVLPAAQPDPKQVPTLYQLEDLQATKNSCLYVDLAADGTVRAPASVADVVSAEKYIKELSDRFFSLSFMVAGNSEKGTLTLTESDKTRIRAAWHSLTEPSSRRGPAV